MTGADAKPAGTGLLGLGEAVARIIALVRPVEEVEEVALTAAVGRVLARTVTSAMALPPFDHSAMDGYAVRSQDCAGAPPFRLPMIGRIAAGDAGSAVLTSPGAVRIFTGAPLPPGCDAVVMQEHCVAEDGDILVQKAASPGLNIRRAGEDVATGSIILTAGTPLDARHVAIAAACGIPVLPVRRQVRVAILSTGNELREPGERLDGGAIFESNRHMLHALLASRPVQVSDLGACSDDPDRLTEVLAEAARTHDLVLTTGGVSVGEEDYLPAVLHRYCRQVEVLKIAIKPGKPLAAGRSEQAMTLALPGNPFSAMMSFLLLGRPVLKRLCAIEGGGTGTRVAIAAFEDSQNRTRDEYVPAAIDGYDEWERPKLRRIGKGGAARLRPLLEADGIARLPAASAPIRAGDTLAFLDFTAAFAGW